MDWDFTLDNHDCDVITEAYEKLYVLVMASEPDGYDKDLFDCYMSRNGEFTYLLTFTSLWNAEQYATKHEMDRQKYVITDVSPTDIFTRFRCVSIDGERLLAFAHNSRPIITPLMLPTYSLYPNENTIWLYYKCNKTERIVHDRDFILADTVPDRLRTAMTDVVGIYPEDICNYTMIGTTLKDIHKEHEWLSCRGIEWNITDALRLSKSQRIERGEE
jgi:hypothetical protein